LKNNIYDLASFLDYSRRIRHHTLKHKIIKMQGKTIKLQDLKIKTIQVNPNDDVTNNTNLNDGGYTWVG